MFDFRGFHVKCVVCKKDGMMGIADGFGTVVRFSCFYCPYTFEVQAYGSGAIFIESNQDHSDLRDVQPE